MLMRRSLATLVLLACAAILPGCGSGVASDPNLLANPTPTPTPTIQPMPSPTATPTPTPTPTATPTATPTPTPVIGIADGTYSGQLACNGHYEDYLMGEIVDQPTTASEVATFLNGNYMLGDSAIAVGDIRTDGQDGYKVTRIDKTDNSYTITFSAGISVGKYLLMGTEVVTYSKVDDHTIKYNSVLDTWDATNTIHWVFKGSGNLTR